MNSKELKNEIEQLYVKSLDCNDSNYIIILDSIKSIIGMNLESINCKLLNFFNKHIDKADFNNIKINSFDKIPEAISMYSLEESLLNRDADASIENVFYLSRVSDGLQILEFLLEFSLRYCNKSYKYIWHIIRMQKFLNGKYMLNSLNKSVMLILSEDFHDSLIDDSKEIKWLDFLSLEFEENNELLLYYTIYKSDLIREISIKNIIRSRLFTILDKTKNKIDNVLNIDDIQITEGRSWIYDYIHRINDNEIDFDIIRFLDSVRSCLMLSDNELEIRCLWSYLNNKLCD